MYDYATRVQQLDLRVDHRTGAIRSVRVIRTVRFTDPRGLLAAPTPAPGVAVAEPTALNGLNPERLNGNAAVLGRSFDPEGIVISPRDGDLLVADEYGPSVYEFDRAGRLLRIFQTPVNLRPRLRDGTGSAPGSLDYVQGRAAGGVYYGRQDNRGFEGLAVSPDGTRLYAVLQGPLTEEPGPNNGRDGRYARLVVFDNDPRSATYLQGVAQYAYALESQVDVAARINAARPGNATPTDPRQGRNIGLSAIVALSATQFLVLERDNRGLGVDDPAGANAIGSKRVFRIDLDGATDISNVTLGGTALPGDVVAVTKSVTPWIDLAADTVLPDSQHAEKWEGLTIGPRLRGGAFAIVAGTDNDYSVTQTVGTQGAASVQFDLYVDFHGNSLRRDLDRARFLDDVDVGPPPAGYSLLPAVLHAYRAQAGALPEYRPPRAAIR